MNHVFLFVFKKFIIKRLAESLGDALTNQQDSPRKKSGQLVFFLLYAFIFVYLKICSSKQFCFFLVQTTIVFLFSSSSLPHLCKLCQCQIMVVLRFFCVELQCTIRPLLPQVSHNFFNSLASSNLLPCASYSKFVLLPPKLSSN